MFFFGFWGKLEHPKESHSNMGGEHANSWQNGLLAQFKLKPGTFLLRGDSATHFAINALMKIVIMGDKFEVES